MEHAHRKGAGTDRRVQHAQLGDGANDGLYLVGVEEFPGVFIVEEIAEPVAPVWAVAVRGAAVLG